MHKKKRTRNLFFLLNIAFELYVLQGQKEDSHFQVLSLYTSITQLVHFGAVTYNAATNLACRQQSFSTGAIANPNSLMIPIFDAYSSENRATYYHRLGAAVENSLRAKKKRITKTRNLNSKWPTTLVIFKCELQQQVFSSVPPSSLCTLKCFSTLIFNAVCMQGFHHK